MPAAHHSERACKKRYYSTTKANLPAYFDRVYVHNEYTEHVPRGKPLVAMACPEYAAEDQASNELRRKVQMIKQKNRHTGKGPLA